MRKLSDIEPKAVFSFFEDICSIPHGSGNTKGISDYLVSFAKEHGFSYQQDKLNNVIIFSAGTKGMETHMPVILQGHMDMVCEKDKDCPIDMEKEAIEVMHNDKVVYAKGTTLGGDDGIAVAFILALLADKSIAHPPIEAVFTVDEETGMEGAAFIDLSALKGKMLINIDSEDEGVFTVSCAGGAKSTLHLPVRRSMQKGECYTVCVEGCIGGHSGVEIHKNRANANKVLSAFMQDVLEESPALCSLSGGAKDNAIPRSAMAEFLLFSEQEAKLFALAKAWEDKIKSQYDEPHIKIVVKAGGLATRQAVLPADSAKLFSLLEQVPNGIQAWSQEIEGLVQTSLNLGVLALTEHEATLTFAVRSSVNQEKEALTDQLKKLAEDFGASYAEHGAYPAWEFQKDSHLRETCVQAFEALFGKKPKIEAIHAGLECGLFSEKIPSVDCISIGPQLHDVHTSRETLEIASAARTYQLLLEILKAL